ncbi:MAG: isopentenyl phosphate kinase [Candidatus Aenigmatarchaeota archaeon]
MEDLILVKLGGSIITNPNVIEKPRLREINRLMREIKIAKEKKKFKIIVGNGGGSFPHVPAKKYNLKEGIKDEKSLYGVSLTQDAAARLHRIIFRFAIRNKLNPFSIPPSSVCITEKGRVKKIFIDTFLKALDINLTPITYGDVGLDTINGISIISTEEIIRAIAVNDEINQKFRIKKIIFATDVDGVYDIDPKISKKARLIKKMSIRDAENILNSISDGKRKFNVTGGMREKVEKAIEIVKEVGTTCQIINGKKPGYLLKALLDKKIRSTIISIK